jgi:uncharacterized protein
LPISITPIYAAVLVALFILLAVRVLLYRRTAKIALGDGNDPELRNRVRAHGNLSEYAPMGLIALLLAELAGASGFWLHLTGVSLVLGRLVHAAHLSFFPKTYVLRIVALVLTFSAMGRAVTLALINAY